MSRKPGIKISSPMLDDSNELTQDQLLVIVKRNLEPMIDEFVESHRGKEFTAKDIEGLYKKLTNHLNENIQKVKSNQRRFEAINFEEEAERIAEEINKVNPIKFSDKLIRGFADFCKKIGLESLGAACLEHIEKVDLQGKLDAIAEQVAKTKTIAGSTRNDNEKLTKISKHPKQLEH